jgi:hypothetical protein
MAAGSAHDLEMRLFLPSKLSADKVAPSAMTR